MTSQLHQVAITYVTRRWLWVVAGIAVLGFGPMVAMTFGPNLHRGDGSVALPIVGVAAAVVASIAATQAKWQFCNPRARLMPGFASPHLTPLLGLLGLGCGLYPLLAALAARWSLLGVPACSIVMAASIIWALQRPGWLPTVTGMITFLSLMTPAGLAFWVNRDHAILFSPLHVAILVAGWSSVAYWVHRLTNVREEDADYAIPIHAQQGAATRMERTQAARALGQHLARGSWQARQSDWWHDRLITIHATTIAVRQRLLRYGFTPTPLWINAVGMAFGMGGMMLLISRFTIARKTDPFGGFTMLWMMILMPAMMAGGVLTLRRPRMGQELMYPLRRADYLNGLFKATALNAVIVWLLTHAALVGMTYLLAPNRLFVAYLAALTALSLGVQIYAFGAFAGIARKNSGSVRAIAALVVAVPAMIALAIGAHNLPRPIVTAAEREQTVQREYAETRSMHGQGMPPETQQQLLTHLRETVARRANGPRSYPYVTWVLAAVLTAAGLAAFLHSRRRWLELDLG